jgi:hypothetical protein
MPAIRAASPIAILAAVAAAALVVTGFLNLFERGRRQQQALEAMNVRLQAAERALATLEPIRKVIAEGPPSLRVEGAYRARQAVGPPDARSQGMDSPTSWCPARENGGDEWLELTYRPAVTAVRLRVHANYAPAALVRVTRIGPDGAEGELWSGEPTGTVEFPAPVELGHIKLHFDTAKVPGWNEVDAVALLDAAGKEHWAATAVASSEWTQR